MLTRRHPLKWFAALNLPLSRWTGDLAGVPEASGPDAAPLDLEPFERLDRLDPKDLAMLGPRANCSLDDPRVPTLIRRVGPSSTPPSG